MYVHWEWGGRKRDWLACVFVCAFKILTFNFYFLISGIKKLFRAHFKTAHTFLMTMSKGSELSDGATDTSI